MLRTYQLTCVRFRVYLQKLETYIEVRHRYLQSWAFHEMSTPSIGSTLEKLVDCLRTLYEQVIYKILLLIF